MLYFMLTYIVVPLCILGLFGMGVMLLGVLWEAGRQW